MILVSWLPGFPVYDADAGTAGFLRVGIHSRSSNLARRKGVAMAFRKLPTGDIRDASREQQSMTTEKLRLYLETSVWNFSFADDAPERMNSTKRFFDEVRRGAHDVYTSNLVLREISRAPEPRRSELVGLMEEISPVILPMPDEIETIVSRLVTEGVVPAKYDDDAAHIAIALVNDVDVLVSWNFKHIVKVKTRRMVSALCRMLGYREVDICTPEEVCVDG